MNFIASLFFYRLVIFLEKIVDNSRMEPIMILTIIIEEMQLISDWGFQNDRAFNVGKLHPLCK